MKTRKNLLGLLTEPVESLVLQVPRALVASGLSALVDFGLLILLVEQFGLHPLPAAVIGYLVGGILQYFLSAWWVFPAAPTNATVGFAAFTVLSLVGLAITWATMALVHDLGHLNYGIAKVLALGLAFCWNFLSRKYWLFRSIPRAEQA